MSQPGSLAISDIEQQRNAHQRRDEMPKPAGADSVNTNNGAAAIPKLPSPPKIVQAVWTDQNEPDSPNTAIRKTLNLPPNSGMMPSSQYGPAAGGSFSFAHMPNKNVGNSNKNGNLQNSTGFPGLRRTGSGSSASNVMVGNQSIVYSSSMVANQRPPVSSSHYVNNPAFSGASVSTTSLNHGKNTHNSAMSPTEYLEHQPRASAGSPRLSGINPLVSDIEMLQGHVRRLSIGEQSGPDVSKVSHFYNVSTFDIRKSDVLEQIHLNIIYLYIHTNF
jgi:hypothetical protein